MLVNDVAAEVVANARVEPCGTEIDGDQGAANDPRQPAPVSAMSLASSVFAGRARPSASNATPCGSERPPGRPPGTQTMPSARYAYASTSDSPAPCAVAKIFVTPGVAGGPTRTAPRPVAFWPNPGFVSNLTRLPVCFHV